MKYVVNNCLDAAWNMAHDEFLLEGLEDKVFCLWRNAPSVIIGLNQSAFAEVNLPYLKENGIGLARRVTGGGAVYHDLQNLNYSIAGPVRQMENAIDLLPEALRRLGVPVERSGRNDLLIDGRKCSGYAKRLSRNRMMIHGTLRWDVDIQVLTESLKVPGSKLEAAGIASVRSRVANLREYLPQFPDVLTFQSALQAILAEGDAEVKLSREQLWAIDRQAREKFFRWDWIYGHSPEASFRSRRKFACGTIEVYYRLKHGTLQRVCFGGDFIGNRPAAELAACLEGLRLEEVASLDVSSYFDGLSGEEFATLFQ